MKKIVSLILSSFILCSTVSCSFNSNTESSATTEQTTTVSSTATTSTSSLEKTLDNYGFEGVLYAVKDNNVVASFAKGTMENGVPITIDTPMPIGSVSKQFCAASILLLQEQGKLSVNDTLDKYFPEYSESSGITLKDMLSMQSGIPNFTDECFEITTIDNTDEENTATLKNWIFSKELDFEPGKKFTYSNSNFFLLGNIVEQVSGKKYIDFLRENFFTPLGMTNTGSICELDSDPKWTQGITYQNIDLQPGLTKGAGDLISNAHDMELWLNALHSGKVISKESYKAMTTDDTNAYHYGYGLSLDILGGVGHNGAIGNYYSYDYLNEDNNFILFMSSNTVGGSNLDSLLNKLLQELM